MIIKEAVYETCNCCNYRTGVILEEKVIGCDVCQKEWQTDYPLALTVFYEETASRSYHVCSWQCVFDLLPTLNGYSFIDMPTLKPYQLQEFLNATRTLP